MSNLKSWIRIEGGSKLEISVDVPAGKIVGSRVRSVDSNNNERQLDESDLQPGPAKIQLNSGRDYSIRIRLAFADACTATIKARIVKPGGAVHGTPYTYAVTAGAGAVRRATIACRTL